MLATMSDYRPISVASNRKQRIFVSVRSACSSRAETGFILYVNQRRPEQGSRVQRLIFNRRSHQRPEAKETTGNVTCARQRTSRQSQATKQPVATGVRRCRNPHACKRRSGARLANRFFLHSQQCCVVIVSSRSLRSTRSSSSRAIHNFQQHGIVSNRVGQRKQEKQEQVEIVSLVILAEKNIIAVIIA